MKPVYTLIAVLAACLVATACEGTGNPFAGSQWDVGVHHVSFSHGVAEWNTAENRLELKFDLLSGATYPNALVVVDEVTTLTINSPREVTVRINISQNLSYEADPAFSGANATVTFTRLDLDPLGAVSGTIDGTVRDVLNPTDPPVALQATFADMIVTN